MEELRSLDLLATPERPHVRDLQYDDLGKLHYLSCAIKVRSRVSPQHKDDVIRLMWHEAEMAGASRDTYPPLTTLLTRMNYVSMPDDRVQESTTPSVTFAMPGRSR